MKIRKVVFRPIGVIHTPHKEEDKTPIQPVFSRGIKGTVEVYPEYRMGLKDLEGFSHIHLLYFFDRAIDVKLQASPYLDSIIHGVFAIRTPCRPNKIGMSLARLISIQDNILHIEDVDILDKTPLLDIKPYIHKFDSRERSCAGWLENIPKETAQSMGSRIHLKETGESSENERSKTEPEK